MGFVYVFVYKFTLDLRNGATYEYEICTANSCDDTLKSEVLIFYLFQLFSEKTRIYQISMFALYL